MIGVSVSKPMTFLVIRIGSAPPVILILADVFDTHADVVERHIREAGIPSFRLNLDVNALQNTRLQHDVEGWTIEQNNLSFHSNDIGCVWPRRLTVSLTLEQQTEPESRSFRLWRSEWNRCLYGMYAALKDRYWMNAISNAALADNKYHQFKVAREVGFDIPELISSNDRKALTAFCDAGPTAIKFMTQDIFKLDDDTFSGIYVNKISASDLSEFALDSENPVTLQRYVEKDFEVRHTVVGSEHFCCKIESQRSDRANIDWRRYDVAHTPHAIISAPDHIISKVESILDQLGLTYGAFDFIVDKEGRWWYLEINSAGQWLWIEDLLGLPISQSIARHLADRLQE